MIGILRILKNDRISKALTGMSVKEIMALKDQFSKNLRKVKEAKVPNRQRAYGAGQKGTLKTDLEKLIVGLIYLKVYPTFDVLGVMFNADRSQCHRWIKDIFAALELTLNHKLVLPARQINSVNEFIQKFPDIKDVFIDGTERKVNRPINKNRAKKLYSGRKKQIARKNIVACDERRKILCLSKTKSARRHDKRLGDKFGLTQSIPDDVTLWVDTGFSGIKHPNLQIPKRATKNHPLSFIDKANNKIISGIRVIVEHAICGIKRMKSASDQYRNHIANFDDQMTLLCSGLWNFHLSMTA